MNQVGVVKIHTRIPVLKPNWETLSAGPPVTGNQKIGANQTRMMGLPAIRTVLASAAQTPNNRHFLMMGRLLILPVIADKNSGNVVPFYRSHKLEHLVNFSVDNFLISLRKFKY